MIEFKNVTKKYGESVILKDLSLHITEGQFVVLIGPSGCGKTTTLRCINRLIKPDSGQILVKGKNIAEINPVDLRRNIGYVIQQIGLFPNMTIEQNITIVPKLLKRSKDECKKTAKDLLSLVDMSYEEYAKKYPSQLSGGQQQRIGVLRALAASPYIVLMDEPFGALDPMTRELLQDEVKKIQKKLKKTIVFVTHDMDEALRLADVIIFMNKGEIVQMATPEEMLSNPADDLIKGFLGKHINNQVSLKVSDFMKTKLLKVTKDKKVLECIEFMKNKEVSSVIVIDDEEKYLGTVQIEEIKKHGKAGNTIESLINKENNSVDIESDAKEAFDLLLEKGLSYIVVLTENNKPAGIITKTSMAKAMGDKLWGDET